MRTIRTFLRTELTPSVLVLVATLVHAEQSPNDDAASRIQTRLDSTSEAARRWAVRRIPALGSDAGTPLLERALADPSDRVRAEAVKSLFQWEPETALARARAGIARETARVRRAYVEAVGTMAAAPAGAIDEFLLASLDDPATGVREAAARALERRWNRPVELDPRLPEAHRRAQVAEVRAWWDDARAKSAAERLADSLTSPLARERGRALRSLASLPPDQAIGPLLTALRDPAKPLRAFAIDSLSDLVLGEISIDADLDPEETVESRALLQTWWSSRKSRGSAEAILEGALGSARGRDRGRAILELARLRGPDAIEPALELLEDPSSLVRARANDALEIATGISIRFDPDSPPDRRAEEAGRWRVWRDRNRELSRDEGLLGALASEDAKLRARAARSLGETSSRESIAALLPLLEDPAGGVRSRAHRAIERLAGRAFDYDPDLAPTERRKKRQAIEDWWRREGD